MSISEVPVNLDLGFYVCCRTDMLTGNLYVPPTKPPNRSDEVAMQVRT
jgi:hypothetical protein